MVKILTYIMVIGIAYWYWQGPYQKGDSISYEEQLDQNNRDMYRCLRATDYAVGASGTAAGNAEQKCAARYNLYRENDKWHRYDQKRPPN